MLTNCVFIHLDVYFIYNYLVSMKLKAKESEEILLNHLENELIVQQVRYITWLRKICNNIYECYSFKYYSIIERIDI